MYRNSLKPACRVGSAACAAIIAILALCRKIMASALPLSTPVSLLRRPASLGAGGGRITGLTQGVPDIRARYKAATGHTSGRVCAKRFHRPFIGQAVLYRTPCTLTVVHVVAFESISLNITQYHTTYRAILGVLQFTCSPRKASA